MMILFVKIYVDNRLLFVRSGGWKRVEFENKNIIDLIVYIDPDKTE